MAKLTARGRKTLIECRREYDRATLQAAHDRRYHDGHLASTIWQRVTRRLMSDRTVLQKLDIQFQDGQKHSYGWTVHGKLRAEFQPTDFARIYRAPTKSGRPSPWTVTETCAHLPRATVLDVKRIARAAQRDDMTGFCTMCGSSQHGVEPDAHGIPCERCGELAVTGALTY